MPQNTVREIFRRNINALLGKKNITQKDLAEYMGVSPTTVNNWVKGYKIPRMDKIDKLCSFFGVDRSALIEPASAPQDEESPEFSSRQEQSESTSVLDDPEIRCLARNGMQGSPEEQAKKKERLKKLLEAFFDE